MEERTGAMGLVAASGGLGFIIGPLMSIMFGGIEGNVSKRNHLHMRASVPACPCLSVVQSACQCAPGLAL